MNKTQKRAQEMNEFQIKNVGIDIYNYGEETLSKKTIYRNALDCASRQKGAKHYVQQQL